MIQCKALETISTRKQGVLITFKPNDTFETTQEEAERLKNLKAISVVGEVADQDSEVKYLNQSELDKKNKEALMKYAISIGLELNTGIKKDDMVYQILDYIEELKDGVAEL